MACATIDDIAESRDSAKDRNWMGVAWGYAVSIFSLFAGRAPRHVRFSDLMLDGLWVVLLFETVQKCDSWDVLCGGECSAVIFTIL